MGLVPPTVLIAFALGSILAGWATPAEAAACGAFGSILLSVAYKKLTVAKFYDAPDQDARNICADHVPGSCIQLLWCGVLQSGNALNILTEVLLSLDLSIQRMLILVMALIFLLGWPA